MFVNTVVALAVLGSLAVLLRVLYNLKLYILFN